MWFIPYERMTIKTTLREEQILDKLESNIEPFRLFAWAKTSHKPLQGKIKGRHFSAWRVIRYRNSFLPIINGNIRSEMGTSYIQITMHPHFVVIAFMVVWLGFVGLGFLSSLEKIISQGLQKGILPQDVIPGLLILGGMFLFGYLLLLIGFKAESSKSKQFLCSLFEPIEVKDFDLMSLIRRQEN